MKYVLHDDGSVELGAGVVPVPRTISAEAQEMLRSVALLPSPEGPLWERRTDLDAQMRQLDDLARSIFSTTETKAIIGGVPCHIVRPADGGDDSRTLINLHSGGFVMGSGSLVEAIPIAALTNCAVIAVDYRLAPENHYPAPVEDVLAVYREILERHEPSNVGIYGTSAGAFLVAQTIKRMERDELPLPSCTGMFTGGGDLTDLGDSAAMFNMAGFAGSGVPPYGNPDSEITAYLADADVDDPVVSPLRGDLSGFPPTLLVTSTRDVLLSATTLMHRALRRAGVSAELYVFEGLTHAFWFNVYLPEAREAIEIMATFLRDHVGLAAER